MNPWDRFPDVWVTTKCNHEWVNLSLFRAKWVCKKCDEEMKEDSNEQQKQKW